MQNIEPTDQRRLLVMARRAIRDRLAGRSAAAAPDEPPSAALQQARGNFVSLHLGGELRGCMGTLEPEGSLADGVVSNACHAAFDDPRFAPLTLPEFNRVAIDISVLELPQPVFPGSEAALCRLLRPGVDGLIVQWGRQRATFLPVVWAQLPEPAAFLAQLRLKAGLPADFWADELRWWRYGAQHFAEADFGLPHRN